MSQSQLAQAARVPQPNLSAYENGRREPSPQVLDRIRKALAGRPSERVDRLRNDILRLVEEHHASAPHVFGSVARGEDRPGSDVDFVVDFSEHATLLDEVGLRLALSDLLQVDVDVVGSDSLRSPLRERVEREMVPV